MDGMASDRRFLSTSFAHGWFYFEFVAQHAGRLVHRPAFDGSTSGRRNRDSRICVADSPHLGARLSA